jgi:hypothetical protein
LLWKDGFSPDGLVGVIFVTSLILVGDLVIVLCENWLVL